MAQRLKRWESPRQEGRNTKGRGGSARQRQKRKQMKQLIRKLKAEGTDPPISKPRQPTQHQPNQGGQDPKSWPPWFLTLLQNRFLQSLPESRMWEAR